MLPLSQGARAPGRRKVPEREDAAAQSPSERMRQPKARARGCGSPNNFNMKNYGGN